MRLRSLLVVEHCPSNDKTLIPFQKNDRTLIILTSWCKQFAHEYLHAKISYCELYIRFIHECMHLDYFFFFFYEWLIIILTDSLFFRRTSHNGADLVWIAVWEMIAVTIESMTELIPLTMMKGMIGWRIPLLVITNPTPMCLKGGILMIQCMILMVEKACVVLLIPQMYPHHQYWCLYLVLGKLTVCLFWFTFAFVGCYVVVHFLLVINMAYFTVHWDLLYLLHLKLPCVCWGTRVDPPRMKKMVVHRVEKHGLALKWVDQHRSFLYLRLSDRILGVFEGELWVMTLSWGI